MGSRATARTRLVASNLPSPPPSLDVTCLDPLLLLRLFTSRSGGLRWTRTFLIWQDPTDPDSASAINTPDVAMAGVARYVERFFSQELFYEAAANGTLPAFSWVHPPIQACDHPCHDVAKGERLLSVTSYPPTMHRSVAWCRSQAERYILPCRSVAW